MVIRRAHWSPLTKMPQVRLNWVYQEGMEASFLLVSNGPYQIAQTDSAACVKGRIERTDFLQSWS